MAAARDIAFDIRARDRTQSAFDSAERNAREFGMGMKAAKAEADMLTASTDRLAAAQRKAAAASKVMGANDNWQRRNLAMQMMDVTQMLALGQAPMQTLLQQGPQIAQIYGPGEGGVGRAFKEMGSMVLGAVTKFPLLTAAAAAVGIGFAGLTYEIQQAGGATVTMGDTALAVFQVIGEAIYSSLQPAINAIAPWFASAWDLIVSGAKTTINSLIGGFLVASDAIGSAAMAIPDAFIAAGEMAANGFLSAIEDMAQEAVAMINGLIAKMNGMLRSAGIPNQIGDLGSPNSISFGRVDIGGAGARQRLGEDFNGFRARAGDIMGRDYAGEFFNEVRLKAQANAFARLAEEAEKAGGRTKKAGEQAADPWKGLRKVTEDVWKEFERQQAIWNDFGGKAGGILKGLLDGTLSWKDALLQAGRAVLSLLNQMNPNMFGGGFFQGLLQSFLGFANGGVFGPGGVTPFARGGIVNRPTVFPFAKGVGLMGEAGPEAIMPLRRGADGKLGVAAGSAGASHPSQQTTNVYHIDARGADQAAVARLERALHERDKKFDSRVDARFKTRQVRGTRG